MKLHEIELRVREEVREEEADALCFLLTVLTWNFKYASSEMTVEYAAWIVFLSFCFFFRILFIFMFIVVE